MACASCHFHAGADARVKNQLSPGRRPSATTFEPMASGAAGGPNYTLRLSDFPLHELADPADFGSAVLFTTDDVVGSAGSFGGEFRGTSDAASPLDDCVRSADPLFNVHGVGTRRVTSRNAPSVINAVFDRRTFWDGRANATFNGVNSFGPRDPDAGVWLWRDGRLRRKRHALANSSLASQAVEPPLDTKEMSCSGRTFADIGRKLLGRRALQFQAVHPDDSVLGRRRARSGNGLRMTYAALVRSAFDRRYWAAPKAKSRATLGAPAAGGRPYTQMEANFALFFGLAIQLYESTLISDDAPFDSPRSADGLPGALDEQQRRGLTAFIDLHCSECHAGPTLAGGVGVVAPGDVDRKPIHAASGAPMLGLVDTGFVNTGVVPEEDDPGVGGMDPFGNPLSFTAQYLDLLAGRPERVLDLMSARSCAMTAPFATSSFGLPAFPPAELTGDPAGDDGCLAPRWAAVPTPAVTQRERGAADGGRLGTGTSGAFKVPSLRNVELTGPYMHNGGMATLEEVLQFYDRGGNFASAGKDAQFLFGARSPASTLADIAAFLRSLTDERVRFERAPFDHPALPLPNGHPGDERAAASATLGLAATEMLELPAVGASGRDAALGPLRAFVDRVQP
jgi:cytochrome c peroxidase